jgi:Holliday junction resolvase RusA-like endonuclease
VILFEVVGLPAPQGSKTRMPNGAMVEGGSTSGRLALKDWRTACADAARVQASIHGGIATPVKVIVSFRFPMPKSRTKAERAGGWLWKVGKPDLDKLCRALGDSLVHGGLITRDEIIVAWAANKIEVADEWTGARIRLESPVPPLAEVAP